MSLRLQSAFIESPPGDLKVDPSWLDTHPETSLFLPAPSRWSRLALLRFEPLTESPGEPSIGHTAVLVVSDLTLGSENRSLGLMVTSLTILQAAARGPRLIVVVHRQ